MLYPTIQSQIDRLDTSSISPERKAIVQPLVDFVQNKIDQNVTVNLNFICTHNSRRSHLAQVWAQAMADYFNVTQVFCYSGGTEATALFPLAAVTLEDSGFKVQKLTREDNPIYSIKYNDEKHPVIGFSKTYDAEFNPKSNFAAILTCSSADKGCPFVAGAQKRIPITFEDPKAFDDTPLQQQKYRERSLEIATELKYVFSNISNGVK